MRKFSFWKIVSLIFVCALLVGALAANVTAAENEGEDEPAVAIVSNNVFYGSTYQIMYAISAPSEPTVTAVDSKGNEVKVIPFAEKPVENVNGVNCYIYVTKSGVAAQAIDEVITVTATCGNETATQKYSVLQYVYERLNVKNVAQGAERTMFEALLAYADAANAFINKESGSFTAYTYVTVEGGTIDGANAVGMFAPNATPFANIEADEFDTAEYKVEWLVSVDGAEAVRYTDDEIKTLAVSGDNMTVTAELVSNECPHTQWNDATCTEAKTCVACGATDGEALGHDWNDATCTAPKTCETCGATEGAPLGHDWANATCTAPKTCETCGATEGAALGHDWANATCTAPKTCETCGATEGAALGHDWNDATCTDPKTCATCGATDGEADENNHNYVDNTCEYCGDVKVVVTYSDTKYTFANYPEGTQYGDNEVHVLDGTLTVVTNDAHFTTELRLYSSSTYNAYAIFKSSTSITKITVNAGNKTDTLIVYGSNDEGATWTPVAEIGVTSSYKDYTAELGDAYSWIKLDVKGDQQVRLQYITLTRVDCSHANTSTKETEANCTENGYSIVVCKDCGAEVSKEIIEEAYGHSYNDGVVTTPATCTADGLKTYTCVCGHTYTEKIEKTGHTTDSGICGNCNQEVGAGSNTPAEPSLLATFEFGDNGSASHADGNEKTSYSEKNNDYTLTLTSMSKVYGGARDAKGNSALKLGTSSAAGKFSFTVDSSVSKVIIYVAKYKTNTSKVTINGTTYTIDKASNNGEYMAIEIDTSGNKTVELTTVSGGYRCMINTIEFFGN